MPPPPDSLSAEDRRILLALARQAIQAALEERPAPQPPEREALRRVCGVFVSLHAGSRLRGCIGMIESPAPLPETVARVARNAAFEDPRFPPLAAEELPGVAIEISVLSPMQLTPPELIEPGRHGLWIRKSHFSGLLLPQVAARYQWNRERFLEETCAKAGLDRQAWRDPETRIHTFTAEVFSE
jgi:AmmeMemoRadiSam system protein A